MANTETNQDKLKALQLTLDKIEKNFGKGSVAIMSWKMSQ